MRYTVNAIRNRLVGVEEGFITSFLLLRSRVFEETKGEFELVPYSGVRTVKEQARLWRQRRSASEINARIRFLYEHNAVYLAACISIVGPQYGTARAATPGNSWHQHGKALDFYILRKDGSADWTQKHYQKIHTEYVDLSNKLYGIGPHDLNHLQCISSPSPNQNGLSWEEISRICEDKFGDME